MKFSATILLILAIAGSVFFASCTKSYTCQCSISYSGTPGLSDTTETYGITNTPNGAKSQCQSNSTTYTNTTTGNTITTTEKCVLY